MVSAVHSPYSTQQITAWLRGLLTVAWADGHFDADEQVLINALMRDELVPCLKVDQFEPISPEELGTALGPDQEIRENFLRTAVMVALADGVYSPTEAEVLHHFCKVLGLDETVLLSLNATLQDVNALQSQPIGEGVATLGPAPSAHGPDVLHPVRDWLDGLEVHDRHLARFLCRLIPSQCPFERNITLFGKKVVHIPPLCKLNPLYDQLVGLRFRALSYLADDCGEDVRPYI